jgi:hypothetical protein
MGYDRAALEKLAERLKNTGHGKHLAQILVE